MTTPDPSFLTSSSTSFFTAPDGQRLAYREVGAGRPVVLLHGMSADAGMWSRTGIVGALVERGRRVIMPDFRGHGDSAKPQDAAGYPSDVLTSDALALVEHLKLDANDADGADGGAGGYDLGGYSLGARIAVRMLVRGATPGRVVIGGQGMREVNGTGGGAGAWLKRLFAGAAAGTWEPGSKEAQAVAAMRERGVDPVATLHVLDSIATSTEEQVAAIRVPALVVVGSEDERVVSARELVAVLPGSRLVEVPGDHGSAAVAPELTDAFVEFLSE
ncbi:alpha/beta fold hydrolase [Streptacidiphilus fuscans]|uniref:Alpha/beta hydrolase n=1 Tax=Streptacidiphilus fuscans TaxID=2789292 RepID=A0A931B9I8_9ACTN|nr:alpha/beta hydrolase [Streptacidiphilus fuscans]MBF9072022.1 alpha/beta hydrolase [Streptacidiphilus fuscans]